MSLSRCFDKAYIVIAGIDVADDLDWLNFAQQHGNFKKTWLSERKIVADNHGVDRWFFVLYT